MKFLLFLFVSIGTSFLFGQDKSEVRIQAAIDYYEKGDFENAKAILNELKSRESDLTSSEKIKVYTNLGNIYADQGENTSSLNSYLTALKLSQKTKSVVEQGKLLKNIGALHVSWKKFPEAVSYYNKALEIGVQNKDEKLLADCFNNLGTVYEQTEDLEKATESYLKALAFYEKKQSYLDMAMVYSNIAIVFKKQKQLDKSIAYNIKAMDYSQKGGDLWMSAAISNNIGNAYSEMNEFALAEKYCQEAVDLSKQIKALEITIIAYESLADLNERKGDFKEAFIYSKKMIEANNQFLNINQTAQFSELEVKFKTQEKELQNQKLKFEKAEIKKQNVFNLIVSILVFSVVLIIVLAFVRLKRQRLLIKKQQEMNQAVIESEIKERFRIARDLHDSVGQMLSVVKMNLSQNPENDAACALVDQTIVEVRQISHNLIPEALNFGLERALEELVEKSQVEDSLTIQLQFAISKNDLKLSQEKELILFRIIQELIGNTLKHAKASRINIDLSLKDQIIFIDFIENGIGFDTNLIHKSNGLGWKNTFARLNLLNGKMTVNSQLNQGSTIKITLSND